MADEDKPEVNDGRREPFSGFIASDPQLRQTSQGNPRLYARVGKQHFRREPDGSYTPTEKTFHHLVMFGRAAEHMHEKFAKGDDFIAEGYTRKVSFERNGESVENEEFVAFKIGHDSSKTRYEVDRTPRRSSAAALGRDASAFAAPERGQAASSPAIGM